MCRKYEHINSIANNQLHEKDHPFKITKLIYLITLQRKLIKALLAKFELSENNIGSKLRFGI